MIAQGTRAGVVGERGRLGVRHLPAGLALGAVLLLGLGLRLWGIDYGLPYAYHPDEPFLIGVAWRMFRTGDLDPNFWDYPTLQIYALLVLIALREGLQPYLPVLATPGMEYLLGRLLNVAYAVGTIYLVYRTGSRLFGRWEGVAGAGLLAVAQQHNLMSHFLKVDVPATFFVAATLAAAVALIERPSLGRYALAGAMVGLSAAGKYPAASIAAVVVLAHAAAWRRDAARQLGRLFLAGGASIVTFALACPYTVLNLRGFLAAFSSDIVGWAAAGHDGWDGDVLTTYLRWLFLGADAPMAWLAVLGLALGLSAARWRMPVVLIGLFPFLFIVELTSIWVVRFPWYVLPIYPSLAVLGGFGAVEAGRRLARLTWSSGRGGVHGESARPRAHARATVGARAQVAWAVVALLAVGVQLSRAADESSLLAAEDVRTTALRWIVATLPPGSRIVREGYTPEVPGDRFRATEIWRAIDKEPAWYRDEGVEYLILGNFMNGRYFEDPEKYAAQVAQYRALMNAGTPVARFTGPLLATRAGVIEVYQLR